MIKLSKAQVYAIASKLASEINKEKEEKYKEETQKLKDKFSKTKEGKLYDAYHAMFTSNDGNSAKVKLPWSGRYGASRIYTSSVENDIQLATIDCKDLNEIMTKLKKQYESKS